MSDEMSKEANVGVEDGKQDEIRNATTNRLGGKEDKVSTNPDRTALSATIDPRRNSSLPPYHDSEPSSQPPWYHTLGERQQHRPKVWTGGASADAVRAVMSEPSSDYEEPKRTWRERWKRWREGHGNDDPKALRTMNTGSRAEFNVWGVNVRDERKRASQSGKRKK